jgi:hypothetical protein
MKQYIVNEWLLEQLKGKQDYSMKIHEYDRYREEPWEQCFANFAKIGPLAKPSQF